MIEKLTPDPGSLLRTAARDPEFGFHVTASWADVQRKAKRIRAEGGVIIVVASHDGIGGQVKGDHDTYESILVYRVGTRKIADWTCSCKWAEYAFDRSPAYAKLAGRKCSHALALQFEAQSREMFGREIKLGSADLPAGSNPRLALPREAMPHPAEPGGASPDQFSESLASLIVAQLKEADADPAEVIGMLIRAGMTHKAAVGVWKTASWPDDDDDDEGQEQHDADRDHEGNCRYFPHDDHDHEDDGSGELRCPHEGGHTDWSRHYKHLPDEIHRGMSMDLHRAGIHSLVHDENEPLESRARTLAQHARTENLGTHWTAQEDLAKHYTAINTSSGHNAHHTEVVFHAAKPARHDIEEDPHELTASDVIGYDKHEDREVPMQRGASVHLKGVSWKSGSQWHRHDFSGGQEHVALLHVGHLDEGHHCPHCGAFLGVEAAEHHRCPHCGAPLGSDHHEGAARGQVGVVDGGQLGSVLAATEDPPGPTVSGIALKAHDTGRVLMLQRGQEEGDPASGRWELPGGHHEDGDLTSLHAGIREWQEEVGQPFPAHGAVKHTWTSPDGIYQGHVVVIPSEKDLIMHNGRVVPNPDDPHGDNHEQAAWWEIEHAKGNKALRDEVRAHTPWKDIEKASLDVPKEASAWDPISNTNPQPGRGTSQPAHSDTTNPASTGFAASDDPDNWNNLDANPEPLTPSLGFDAVLHAEPEPALPVAYGDENATMRPAEMTQDDLDPVPDNPPQSAHLVPDQTGNISLLNGGSSLPNSYHASLGEDEPESSALRMAAIIAEFQKSAAGQQLAAEVTGGDDDIAAAAQAHLAKTAAAKFNFAEQQELINEGGVARNLGDLRIEGTHYELLEAALANEATDSSDLFI